MSCASLIFIGAFLNGKAFRQKKLNKCKENMITGGKMCLNVSEVRKVYEFKC